MIKVHIFTPLKYLRLKGKGLGLYQWQLPLIGTLILLGILIITPNINIFGSNGFIKSINSLLAILVGFFITSLAAIATIESDNLENKLENDGVKLKEKSLTRRIFLCYLFGYNSFLAIVLYIVGELAFIFNENIKTLIPNYKYSLNIIELSIHSCLEIPFLIFYTFFLNSLLITTLFGLHYLSEKIHKISKIH